MGVKNWCSSCLYSTITCGVPGPHPVWLEVMHRLCRGGRSLVMESPPPSCREEERAVGETESEGGALWTLPGCLRLAAEPHAALLGFLGARGWGLLPSRRCGTNGSLEKVHPVPQALTPARICCRQLSGVIPSFLGQLDSPDLLAHKRPCGRLTGRDGCRRKRNCSLCGSKIGHWATARAFWHLWGAP